MHGLMLQYLPPLAGPLVMPSVSEIVSSSQDNAVPSSSSDVCSLLSAIVSNIDCGKYSTVYGYSELLCAHQSSFDSSVGRAVDCSGVVIHRSLVRIRLEGFLFHFNICFCNDIFIFCDCFFCDMSTPPLYSEKYFPFVCDVILKILLGQDNFQSSEAIACLLLSLADKWKNR